jgi:hypothetical protein
LLFPISDTNVLVALNANVLFVVSLILRLRANNEVAENGVFLPASLFEDCVQIVVDRLKSSMGPDNPNCIAFYVSVVSAMNGEAFSIACFFALRTICRVAGGCG